MIVQIKNNDKLEIIEKKNITIINFDKIQKVFISFQNNFIFFLKSYYFVVRLKNNETLYFKLDKKSKDKIKKEILNLNYIINKKSDID